jgi:hypothetical protein
MFREMGFARPAPIEAKTKGQAKAELTSAADTTKRRPRPEEDESVIVVEKLG